MGVTHLNRSFFAMKPPFLNTRQGIEESSSKSKTAQNTIGDDNHHIGMVNMTHICIIKFNIKMISRNSKP